MTVILAANLIEGPILASDSRATHRKTKKPSDTATKIIPLKQDLILGIAGNSRQASALIESLLKEVDSSGMDILLPKNIERTIEKIANETDIVDVNDSRCHLIFAGIDNEHRQIVPVEKLKYYLEKEGQTIIDGEQALGLMISLMKPEFTGEVVFNFPKTFIYHLTYPVINVDAVKLLELGAWGSGGEYVKNELEHEFYKLWDLKTLTKVPNFKRMIFTITLEDIIKKASEEIFIGGLPQIVSLDNISGLNFQSYTRNGTDGKPTITMRFMGDHWEQVNEKTGKVIRTTPSLLAKRNFDPSEIVDFSI